MLLVCMLCAVAGPLRADDGNSFDPKAKAVLAEMVRTYRGIHSLDQETTYEISGSMLARLVRSRLIVERPNRFVLELYERIPEKTQPVVLRYLSDGRSLWSYEEEKGWYSEDRAPKDLTAFRSMASSVEMAAIGGIDPFAALAAQAHSARLGAPVVLDAVQTDVVLLDVGDESRTGEARFYVGQADHLLRKFSFDSKELPKPGEPHPAEPDPPLNPDEELAEPMPPPPPIHFAYMNHVTANAAIGRETFKWVQPPGALRYVEAVNGLVNPSGKTGRGYSIFGKPLDLSKPTEPIDPFKTTKHTRAKDLIDKANKQKP